MSIAVPPMPHAPRLGPQALLGGLLGIAAVACLLGALVEPPALAGPQVLAPAGLVLVGLTAATAVVGRRSTALLVLALAAMLVTTVLVAEAPTLAGQIFCSMAYIYVVLYAAYVLERWRALVVLAAVVVLSFVAQLVSVPGLTPRVWVATIGAITVTGLVLGHVVRLLRWHAGTDTLTGLLTRTTFTLAGRTALAGDRRRQTPTTIAVLDLDHFKSVNDTQGHAAGDAVLRDCVRSWGLRLRRAAHLIARADAEIYAVKRGRPGALASRTAG